MKRKGWIVVVACGLAVGVPNGRSATAQSGSRTYSQPTPQRAPATAGSASREQAPASGSTSAAAPGSSARGSQTEPRIGLAGYCPVCIAAEKQWIAGVTQIAADYDGIRYYFPGEEQLKMFVANPAKYARQAPPAAPAGSATRQPVVAPATGGAGSGSATR